VSWPRRRKHPGTLDSVTALLRLLPAVSRSRTALVALGVLVSTALPIGVTVATGVLVGAIPAAVRGGLASPAAHLALELLAAAAALIVAARLLLPFMAALTDVFGREIDWYVEARLMAAVGRPSGIAHLEDPEVLDLLRTAQGVGTNRLTPGVAVAALASLLPSWLQALASALLLLAFHWQLALAWLVTWPVVLYYLQREYVRVGQVGYGAAGAVRRAEYLRDLALTPGPAKELRLWGMLDWLEERFDAAWLAALQPTWAARHPGRRLVWGASATVTAMSLVSFGLLAWAAAQREIGLAALAVYTQAVMAANSYRAFDDANADLAFAASAVTSVLRLERRLAAGDATPPGSPPPPGSPRIGIHFEQVTFRYPGRSEDALAGLDLLIPAG
jgi:ATP-binding cassette, subfamily B, bacterial